MCSKLNISFTDLLNSLYALQSNGEIGYEAKDESMYIEIEKLPESFKDILDLLNTFVRTNIKLNLVKVKNDLI